MNDNAVCRIPSGNDTHTMSLAAYGERRWAAAMHGLETLTMSPYQAGWRLRVVPSIGHVLVRKVTRRVVNRALHCWIADECGLSTVKNSLAVLVRVLEQAVRDGVLDANPARVAGWQQEYQRAQAERTAPRALALPDADALERLAVTLVQRSSDGYEGWGDIVRFAAWTGTRFSEVSALQAQDIDASTWTWQVQHFTVSEPEGLHDRPCRGRHHRVVPLRPAARELAAGRLERARHTPPARLFTGPHRSRFTAAVLRDATHWDDVVDELGHEYLRRQDLRHTGLTWMADAGLPLPLLCGAAGRPPGDTRRYLPPDGHRLSAESHGEPPASSAPARTSGGGRTVFLHPPTE
ncbi:tyrosine-type recombinase/integrase [Streptomyces sp. Je 1-4]|uniref:tyrosine-type recombinase/integrase n=1 Tax=Streptomyces TaxID=1883 RepID=UPI0021DAA227|nr:MULTISPECIES: tyrosine-type recombinase/integrase [unclassified Streptomyces]UYB42367.1 tyrosine-type recombinase/integrase [Streptomyces sp. Je 1-4]UZQ38667.1 tyrosine-type recombinase/integrase [Streptomyces sp. Je 1-4] [Streptomyces sp. Je 1-4 4N24]UZQ46084.1 tyrosine-type recombinase/integrase [Streptomyces sp. Je 1-4] [Streptomyces sp. Je 1-4 4N24_ara]